MFYKTPDVRIFPKIFKMFLKLLFYNFSRLFQNFLLIISCFSDNFSQVLPKIDVETSRNFLLECLKICTKYCPLLFRIFQYVSIFLTPLDENESVKGTFVSSWSSRRHVGKSVPSQRKQECLECHASLSTILARECDTWSRSHLAKSLDEYPKWECKPGITIGVFCRRQLYLICNKHCLLATETFRL